MMARVRGVILFSTWAGSRLYVTGSMSTNTGRAPVRQTAPAVAKKVKVGRMTSSPGPISRPCRASDSASVPEPQPTP